ncbi:hypothetical protein ACKRLN_01865 [Anaerococcus sp. DFU013_CI05]|uniref:hypothetical protein n=1 Tax=Anaerococcus sp. AH8042_DFU013_CI05 TaxID=3385202 RepID=UPI003A52262A
MKARNPQGKIVEVTKKAYSTLYRYRGWTLVKDEEGKATESVPEAEITPEEVETEEVVSEDKADDTEDKEVEETNKNLSKLKKAELQELASEKGIEFKDDDTKEDLINLING